VDEGQTLTGVDDAGAIPLHPFVRELALEGGALLDGRLAVLLPAPHAVIRAEPDRLRQALLELLNGAANRARGGGPLDLRVLRERDAWRFEVLDDGAPVLHDDADVSLHRATTSPEAYEAMLASVRAFAAAHGWSAGVDLGPGERSTFWLRVPQTL
jgi:hypothetical protein